MRSATLVLFSASYPYSAELEGSFIGAELPYLAREFDRVILVPARLDGTRAEVPDGVEIDGDYAALQANRITARTIAGALGSTLLLEGLRERPATIVQPAALRFLVRHAGNAARTRWWLHGFLERHRIDLQSTLFYTYWLGPTTLGIAREKAADSRIVLVSRAHGYDLYPHRHRPEYIPFQGRTIRMLDRLFLASAAAREYVRGAHPDVASRAEVFRLGVRGDPVLNRPSDDGVLRIASCSYVVPIKRLDLLLRAVAVLGTRASRPVEWYHLGGGSGEAALKAMADDPATMPPGVRCHFLGNLTPDQVRAFYRETPVDVFAHVSASEGGVPVALTEAQSYGIPAVAAAVGGIPELIGPENGILLSADPSPEAVAEALLTFAARSETSWGIRAASRRAWAEGFDADRNFPAFAARLRALLEERAGA